MRRPASGLVTAVEPVMRACSGTWIAHGSGSADREAVDRHDRVGAAAGQERIPAAPHLADRRRRSRATTTASPTRACGRCATWRTCGRCSANPTGSTTGESTSASPTRWWPRRAARTRSCWCRTTTSRCCRRWCASKLPRATILTFWHIPWPNPESFGICPWRREILQGMLGSTILGFHTPLPLQELHRDGGPLPRGAHRARALDDHLPGRARRWSRAIRSRSSGRAEAEQRQWPPVRRVPAPGVRAAGAAPTTIARGRRRPLRLHQGHPRAAERRRAPAGEAPRVDRPLHLRAGGRAVAQRAGGIPAVPGAHRARHRAHQRALRPPPATGRCTCWRSTTSTTR